MSKDIEEVLLANKINSAIIYGHYKSSSQPIKEVFYSGSWSVINEVADFIEDKAYADEVSSFMYGLIIQYARDFR